MKAYYNNNPLSEFYEAMILAITNFFDNESEYTEIDPILNTILKTNGCATASDAEPKQFLHQMNDENNNFILCFVINAVGNEANNLLYDFTVFNGMQYFIIFIDNFSGMLLPPETSLGRYKYYEAITSLVNIFIHITTNPVVFTSTLAATAAGGYYRRIPHVIAGKIIKSICGQITEEDIDPTVDIKYLNTVLDGEYSEYEFYGINTIALYQ